jgi:hypothetical protein
LSLENVNDPTSVSYVWEQLTPDKKLVTTTEWDESFTTQLPIARIADQVDHVMAYDPNVVIPTWRVREACAIRARPMRNTLPVLELDLNAGDELIWTFRQVHKLGIMGDGSGGPTISFKTLIFGRIRNGEPTRIAQIYPDGTVEAQSTLEAALQIT